MIVDPLPAFVFKLVLWVLICAGLTYPALFVCRLVAERFPTRLSRINFQGKTVAVIGGIVLLAAAVPCLAWAFYIRNSLVVYDALQQLISVTLALYGFGLLGLIDDWFGDRSIGGFRGHFHSFFRQRRVTTGFIKAVGGGCIALVCAYFLAEWMLLSSRFLPKLNSHDGVLAFALSLPLYSAWIALSANTINLLDLRPGRASSVAILACAANAFAAAHAGLLPISVASTGLLGILLLLYLFDRNGKIMLGDCGSNAVGAALAVCWICVLNRWEVILGVVLLASFQIWCEKHSLSQLIESKPLLRALDRKIGVR